MDTKKDPDIYCLQETHFRHRDTYRLKMSGWKKLFHANGNKKKAGVAIIISAKIDFKIKIVTRDKEVYLIMIKGSVQEEGTTIVSKYIFTQHRSTAIYEADAHSHKGEIDSNTIIVGDFNTHLHQWTDHPK